MRLLFTTAFGVLAGSLGALMGVPQAVRSVRTGTRGVSAETFQVFVAADMSWIVYSVANGLWVAAIANALLILTGSLILICLIRDGSPFFATTKILLLVLVISGLLWKISVNWLAWWGGALSLLLRWPQIRMVHSADDISDVSVTTWLIGGAANFAWAIYGWLHGDSRLMIICTTVAIVSFGLSAGVIRRQRSHEFHPHLIEDPTTL